MAAPELMTGTIESLNRKTPNAARPTFGFIACGRKSYFFAPSGMDMTSEVAFDDLRPGMRVTFTLIDHPRGPRAIQIRAVK